jgi:hypothetical protein
VDGTSARRSAGIVVLAGTVLVGGAGVTAGGAGALARRGAAALTGGAVDKIAGVEGGGKSRAAGALVGEGCLPVGRESRCRREG